MDVEFRDMLIAPDRSEDEPLSNATKFSFSEEDDGVWYSLNIDIVEGELYIGKYSPDADTEPVCLLSDEQLMDLYDLLDQYAVWINTLFWTGTEHTTMEEIIRPVTMNGV